MVYIINKLVNLIINFYNIVGYNKSIVISSSNNFLSIKHILYESTKIVLFKMFKLNLFITTETIIITSLISFLTNKICYKQKLIDNEPYDKKIFILMFLLKFVLLLLYNIIANINYFVVSHINNFKKENENNT
jgi:hypothetical protein